MDLLVGLAILLLLAIPFAIAIRRSTELFVLRVDRGKVELVRGRAPRALIADIEDVFARTSTSAEIRAVAERGRASVIVKGVSGNLAQRARNVVGRFHIAEIRTGNRRASRATRRAR